MKSSEDLNVLLSLQQRACTRNGIPDLGLRKNRLNRVLQLLIDNQDILCEAMSADFGHYPNKKILITDINAAIVALRHAKKSVHEWIRAEKQGASAYRYYQPKGVVGSLSVWDFPALTSLVHLGGIFSAGNRCMIKLSEFTPFISNLLVELIGQYFDKEELAAINGGGDVSELFCQLSFDHLIFMGSSDARKKIMQSVANSPIPATWELSRKSAIIIGKDANINKSAYNLVREKFFNAGKIAFSPDYVFIKESWLNDFIAEIERAFQEHTRPLLNKSNYSSVVNEKSYQRLIGYINDAKNKGGEIWEILPSCEFFRGQSGIFKIPLTLVINPTDEMLIMQKEIFGPLLAVKIYRHIDEVIEYINRHSRLQGIHYFGDNKKEIDCVIENTSSGEVTINDIAGSVDPCNGIERFREFSHVRTVYKNSKFFL